MKYITLFISLVISNYITCQELNCRLSVNSAAIQSSDRTIFEQMQNSMYEFFNNTVFTNHKIKTQERVEFNLSISLKESMGADEYKAEVQLAYSRPVYGSGYNSPTLNLVDDKVTFRYALQDQIQFNLNSSTSSLSSLLTYYAYLILALDYDTFSLSGGQEFLQVAETVVNNAQSEGTPGWQSFEDNGRNRAALIEDMLNDTYSTYRQCLYKYHRLGLDMMHSKPDEARKEIIEAIELLRPIYQRRRDSYLLQLFLTAKSDEIISIFSEGTPDEKRRAYNLMNTIDPANQEKYKKIMGTR